MVHGVTEQELSRFVLPSFTEEELAASKRKQGIATLRLRGRYWQRRLMTFYQPVHLAARLTPAQASLARFSCLGFRAGLQGQNGKSNGTIPLYVINDIQDYGWHRIQSRRRTQVRKCLETLEYVRVTDPERRVEQGYPVMLSGLERTRYKAPMKRERFRKYMTAFISNDKNLVIGAFKEGKLVAFLTGYAVGDIAYHESTYVAEEGLPDSAGSGLMYLFLEVCSRSPGIRQVVSGTVSLDNEGLHRFKKHMGFELESLPTYYWLNPVVANVLKRYSPRAYHRWVGAAEGWTESPPAATA